MQKSQDREMKKNTLRFIYLLLTAVSVHALTVMAASPLHSSTSAHFFTTNVPIEPTKQDVLLPAEPDSIKGPRYSVRKTAPMNQNDLKKKTADLRDPETLKTETEYDTKTGLYKVGTKIGDSYLNAPLLMTPEEYQQWSMQKSLQSYYRKKNEETFQNAGKDKFNFSDIKFDLGPAEKIFGPGGVQIKTQGSAEREQVQDPSSRNVREG